MRKKKFSRKAALSLAMVASLILALVFTGIGVTIVKRISKEISYGFDKGLCKESVIMNAKFRIPYEEAEQFELNCPTRYVNIGKEMITFETTTNKHEVPIRGIGDLSDRTTRNKFFKIVNPVIADLIFDCWDQFAAGQLPVLSRWEEEAARQCIICARIAFSEDVQGPIGQDFWTGYEPETSLEEYMATNAPSAAGGGQHKITYLEFTLDPVDAFGRDPYEYRVTEPMAVVFSAINEYQLSVLLGDAWEGIKGLMSDSRQPEGSPRFANKLDFVPYNQIKNDCEVLR